ncbi:MAG: carbonic anhydrase [Terracidiphilus sp.]
MRSSAFAALFLALATLAAAQTPVPASAPWSYFGKTGPLNWGKLDPAYRTCSKGEEQSPIDIRGARLNTALRPIEFHYLAGPIKLSNDGNGIVARVLPGSYIVAGGVHYNLVEFSFHHPSETAVKGRLTELEVDLLHKSADGKLVILAVRMREDMTHPNATLATLWENLPVTAGSSKEVKEMVNPGGLLPVDRGYWTYMGSLVTPPCTEGVRWYVFQQTVGLSRWQWQTFAELFPMNTRSLQDPHGRRIDASE